MIPLIQSALDPFIFKNLHRTKQILARKFPIYAWCIEESRLFGKVAKREEHLQNMKKFEKCFDLH